MNYYPHHIGDFNNATRHLSRVERSVYRDLLELYYDTEKPLVLDIKALCRRILATTEQESTAVEQVLNEFFTETQQGWFHERCNAEIVKWNARGWFPSQEPQLRPPIDEWKLTRLRIFERDNFTCLYCRKVGGELECDHIDPVSLGGSNEDSNLATACKTCNRSKSNKTLEQWRQILGAK